MPVERHIRFEISPGRHITMVAPYFNELLQTQEYGVLPREPAAHALWHYFCVVSGAYRKHKENMVLEDDPSIGFHPRELFEGIARQHCVPIAEMCKYWDVVNRQRVALRLDPHDDIPESFKYRQL